MTRKVILVLGKTGQGKSTLMKILFRKAKRIIAFDPMNEYREGADLITRNAMEIFNFFMAEPNRKEFHISYQGIDEIEITHILKLAWTLGNTVILIDESSIYLESKNPTFDRLVSQGRHRNVSLICGTQRTPEVNTKFRAQITSLFTFRQDSPGDLRNMELWGYSIEGIQSLQAITKEDYPNPDPKEGVHYLCFGEKVSEIEFSTQAEYMTDITRMEFFE